MGEPSSASNAAKRKAMIEVMREHLGASVAKERAQLISVVLQDAAGRATTTSVYGFIEQSLLRLRVTPTPTRELILEVAEAWLWAGDVPTMEALRIDGLLSVGVPALDVADYLLTRRVMA